MMVASRIKIINLVLQSALTEKVGYVLCLTSIANERNTALTRSTTNIRYQCNVLVLHVYVSDLNPHQSSHLIAIE